MTTPTYEGYEAIRFARREHLLAVTIDHPGSERNAVDGVLHHELARLMNELCDEAEARVVLLAGSGQTFSAGGDRARCRRRARRPSGTCSPVRLFETVDVATPFELLTFLSADHAEAVQAAVERRPGRYEGR